jgi:hypothetical protein
MLPRMRGVKCHPGRLYAPNAGRAAPTERGHPAEIAEGSEGRAGSGLSLNTLSVRLKLLSAELGS